MRIASWNIAEGHTFSGSVETAHQYEERNLSYFVDELSAVGPNLIALQEATTPKPGSAEISQPDFIAKGLGLNFVESAVYGPSFIEKGDSTSLGNLCEYEIVKSNFHKLPNPGLTVTRPNGDVWVSFVTEVKFNNEKVNFVNGHMVPFHHFNRKFSEDQFSGIREDVTEFLVGVSDRPTIIACDFNYGALTKLLPGLFARDLYREAFSGVETALGRGQQDHVLLSKHWSLKSTEIKKLQTDHCLCIVNVERIG